MYTSEEAHNILTEYGGLPEVTAYDHCKAVDWRYEAIRDIVNDRIARSSYKDDPGIMHALKYFRRMWRVENTVADMIKARSSRKAINAKYLTECSKLVKEFPHIHEAYNLHWKKKKHMYVMEAMLTNRAVGHADIAKVLGIDIKVVSTYAGIFYDVDHFTSDLWLVAEVAPNMLGAVKDIASDDEGWKYLAANTDYDTLVGQWMLCAYSTKTRDGLKDIAACQELYKVTLAVCRIDPNQFNATDIIANHIAYETKLPNVGSDELALTGAHSLLTAVSFGLRSIDDAPMLPAEARCGEGIKQLMATSGYNTQSGDRERPSMTPIVTKTQTPEVIAEKKHVQQDALKAAKSKVKAKTSRKQQKGK